MLRASHLGAHRLLVQHQQEAVHNQQLQQQRRVINQKVLKFTQEN